MGTNLRGEWLGGLRIAGAFCMLTGVCFLCGAGGCWGFQFRETGVAGLEKFATAEEFKAYLAEQVEAVQYWRRGATPDVFFGGLPLMDSGMAPSLLGDGAAAEDGGFSTTNVQEEGVDESDVIKNDGEFLYILGGGKLQIVRAVPADSMEVVSVVEVEGSPIALYLVDDLAVILSTVYESGTNTRVTVVDVSDRGAPAVRVTAQAEGQLLTSRLLGSALHLVLRVSPRLPEATEILASDVHDLIPDVRIERADGSHTSRDVVEWQDFYHPIDADGYSVTAIVSFDVTDPGLSAESVGVMADAGTVYASPTALYLTDQQYNYAGEIRETTDIYKFNLDANGASLAGAGSVPGRLLNRFSLGEHEGHLRAATTFERVSLTGGLEASNNVYVLAEQGGELKIVGRVEGIAPGEQIYSARFLGDRGFLVTFKKIDPLFTLDLSDPANPRVAGELKVPGYSEYIHPLGENHLLTIGKDALDMGDFAWFQGVQISIFDVTDFSNPQQVDVEIVGKRGTESEALNEPHAFNYFAPAGMLAVPMSITEGAGSSPSSYGVRTFEGLCLYRIDPSGGIEPAGRISTRSVDDSPYYWNQAWTRGVFIGDFVYAVTEGEVQALSLADLSAAPIRLSLE